MTEPRPLLTDPEHALIEKLGQCMSDFMHVCGADHPPDLDEFAARIHDLQARIMAQAAARAYPKRYRRLGRFMEKPAEEPLPTKTAADVSIDAEGDMLPRCRTCGATGRHVPTPLDPTGVGHPDHRLAGP